MVVIERVPAQAAGAPTVRTRPGWMRSYVHTLRWIDAASGALAGVSALQIRFAHPLDAASGPWYPLFSLVLPAVWVLAVASAGGYAHRFVGQGTEEFRRVLTAGLVLTAAVAICAYAARIDVARGYVLLALPTAVAASLVMRYAWRKRLHRLRARGRCMRGVVAVGHRESARDLVHRFRREPYHGMRVIGLCLPGAQRWHAARDDVDGCPVLGSFDDAAEAAERVGADTVAVLACPEMDGTRLRRLAWRLEKSGTDLTVAPALMDVAGPRTTIRPVAGLPLLHVEHPELAGARRAVKGLFDRAAAALALVALGPLLLALAVLIRARDRGPALFHQTRVGKDGVQFTLYKFRTMVAGAEDLKGGLRPADEHDGVLFKMRRDPRVTAFGGWLRRYSLDELPQLLNVVRGDMSLVGPRPPLPEEVARYGRDVRRRLVVKPGMTGLWQVSGRSDLSWEESVRLDLRYVENWSLTLDVQILWKTWSAVVRGAGAY
ncbi:sugar transferase [Streptomonospora salina]|uniref:Exopolysaccharide biosynthesis polyprenyl glycosylphosphotransferase n=1 Tax=Streptomonospora salina TaxID=104205 RepID=A0A841E948_9ACTN|nr:sugar transferase [Streptomonospora salina]MBB5999526.1 exopolysaccharide biosynthesis polyprenyl glycosylphosphotransferase [Streptomonospora salina]